MNYLVTHNKRSLSRPNAQNINRLSGKVEPRSNQLTTIFLFLLLPDIYIAPLQGIYAETLSAQACMMLNLVTKEYFHPINKTKHSELKSPQRLAHAHVWSQPSVPFVSRQLTDDAECSEYATFHVRFMEYRITTDIVPSLDKGEGDNNDLYNHCNKVSLNYNYSTQESCR